MSVVTKHNSKQEWESHNSKNRRIGFLVVWDSISVSNLLRNSGHFVQFEVSGWLDLVWFIWVSSPSVKFSSLESLEFFPHSLFLLKRSPHKANVCRVSFFHHVQGVVNCFFLGHKPHVNFKSTDSGILGRHIRDFVNGPKIVLKLFL